MASCTRARSLSAVFGRLMEIRVELHVLDWRVRADPEATRLAHESMQCGGPESCGCGYCRNFAAARQQTYPSQALDLFGRLGIRPNRESEIGTPMRMAEGRWLYTGWFHFVGEILDGPRLPPAVATVPAAGRVAGGTLYALQYKSLVSGFELAFSDEAHLVPETFRGQQVVQLEFATEVPWVLSEPEPAA